MVKGNNRGDSLETGSLSQKERGRVVITVKRNSHQNVRALADRLSIRNQSNAEDHHSTTVTDANVTARNRRLRSHDMQMDLGILPLKGEILVNGESRRRNEEVLSNKPRVGAGRVNAKIAIKNTALP